MKRWPVASAEVRNSVYFDINEDIRVDIEDVLQVGLDVIVDVVGRLKGHP
jgi:hypothetical protein